MRRFNIIQALFVLLLIAAKGNASAGQSGYEYWFDGEYDRKSVSVMESDSVAIDIDIRGLQSGLHFFNLRAWMIITINFEPRKITIKWCGIHH